MKLQGVVDFDRPRLAHALETNLCDYFNWGCVQAGGFVDVAVASPGVRVPRDDSRFSPASAPGVADGLVWKSPHGNWCHERGLDGIADPVRPDGVYVDGAFHTTSSLPHSFDYRRGRVTFQAPLPAGSIVQARYSYRLAPFTTSDSPWAERVVAGGWRFEAEEDADASSILSENDVSTPVCVVEYSGSRKARGVMLGSTGRQGEHVVLVHVLSTDRYEVKHLLDVVTDQMGATLPIYGIDARRAADDFELDAAGSPRPGASNYPEALEAYPYDVVYIRSARDASQPPLRTLYVGTASLEVVTRRADV